MSDTKIPSVPELVKALEVATAEFKAAEERESTESRAKSAALNRLNQAQKTLDTALAAIRSCAPRESDWKQSERRGVPA